MSRMSQRGPSKANPYGVPEANAFIARASESHTVQWKASAYRWDEAGAPELLLDEVPIIGGSLVLDSSDPVRRRLTLEVGGGPDLVPNQPTDPLVPFGQFLRLWCRIDKAGGGWFAWVKQGEFPVLSYVYEWPSEVATVEARDYAGTIEEYLFLNKRGYKDKHLAASISDIAREGLRNRAFNTDATTEAQNAKVKNYVADAGRGRWSVATDMAQAHGHECFFDWEGDLVIRKDVTDDNDETIPGNGPDIGTVSNPIATIRDGDGGNLVGLTATITREGGCNGVRYNLHPTKTKATKGDAEEQSTPIQALQETGAVAWGDTFGHIPIVEARNVHKVTAEVRQAYNDRARHLLHRRRGVVRYIDLDAVGLYWLEPDDKVRVQWSGTSEAHYVQSVEFNLAGGATRIRTRQLSVTDPGSL